MKRKVLPPYHVKTSTSEKKLISTVKEQFIQLKKEEVTIIPYGFTILGDKTSKLIPQVELANHQISLIKKKNGNTYNVGGGIVSNISLKETSKICSEITGNKLRIAKSKIKRINDIRIYISNTNKVQKDFNWSISYKPKRILYDIFLWIKKNEIILKNSIF